jgi:hypothetical protein
MTNADYVLEYARGTAFFLACLNRAAPQWLENMMEE